MMKTKPMYVALFTLTLINENQLKMPKIVISRN